MSAVACRTRLSPHLWCSGRTFILPKSAGDPNPAPNLSVRKDARPLTIPLPHTRMVDCLREILRRDLKLGPDVEIPDDMPLFDSDLDLDSLDALLLLTSIEKEFGIKVATETLNKGVFQTLRALAQFLQDQGAVAEG